MPSIEAVQVALSEKANLFSDYGDSAAFSKKMQFLTLSCFLMHSLYLSFI